MRRTSLTTDEAQKLGQLLREQREARRLGVRRLEAASGVNSASIVELERGNILSPQPNTLRALGDALGLAVSDIFTEIGWLPPDELPALKPYLRAKYRDLDDQAIADLEGYAERLTRRHGTAGPADHEDEAS